MYVVGKKLPYGRRLEMPEEPALELESSASTSAARAVHHLVPALTHKQPRLEEFILIIASL